jgi:hypothetical protein
MQRNVERFADCIPDRSFHARGCDKAQSSIAKNVPRRWAGDRPAPLSPEGILADEFGCNLVVDDGINLFERRVLIACICLTNYT